MDVQGVSIRPIAIPALCRYGGCTDLSVRHGVRYDPNLPLLAPTETSLV
jgi:hypothetical protein